MTRAESTERPANAAPGPGAAGRSGALRRLAPNGVTVARLVAVPVLVLLMAADRLALAFGLFLLATLSDALDGWLARRLRAVTPLGALLDPLADKLLLGTSYVALAAIGALPVWLAVLVVTRDALILTGGFWLRRARPERTLPPLPVSRLNTILQMATAATALGTAAYGVEAMGMLRWLAWLTGAATVVSGLAYLNRARHGCPA